MPYYEYVFVVLLFIGLAALAANVNGYGGMASSLLLGLVGLLMVAIRIEKTNPELTKSQLLGIAGNALEKRSIR